MEFILFVIGVVWIIGSFQYIKSQIKNTLYGLSGSELYNNLESRKPERYGNELTKSEKFFRIFVSVVLGMIYISGGVFCICIAIYNLQTWLPE